MPDLSVLMATYNRAEVLRQTLESMCALDREGLDVEFVIIDNNSKDHTGEVIDAFKDRLPIRHLFQAKQGKSAALNLALDTVELGEIVIFTDDDVIPCHDWLTKIQLSCSKYRDFDIFGGPIPLVWPPDVAVPTWARIASKHGAGFVFSHLDLGEQDLAFPQHVHPAGANAWIRGDILYKERFSELLGPGEARAHGEDLMYVKALRAKGHKALYVGAARVGHLVNPELFNKVQTKKRAVKAGRMGPIFHGLSHRSLFDRAPVLWFVLRLISIARYGFAALLLGVPIPNNGLFLRSLRARWYFGLNMEQLRIGWTSYRQERASATRKGEGSCPK